MGGRRRRRRTGRRQDLASPSLLLPALGLLRRIRHRRLRRLPRETAEDHTVGPRPVPRAPRLGLDELRVVSAARWSGPAACVALKFEQDRGQSLGDASSPVRSRSAVDLFPDHMIGAGHPVVGSPDGPEGVVNDAGEREFGPAPDSGPRGDEILRERLTAGLLRLVVHASSVPRTRLSVSTGPDRTGGSLRRMVRSGR